MIPALLLPGLPPLGKGLYARDSIEPGAWDFIAVNAWRADRGAQAAEARARGAALWLYGTPEHFRPDGWRDSLARMVSEAGRLGAVGVIVDAEGSWVGDSAAAQAEAMGAACRAAADTVRVCFTSYPEWTHLARFAAGAGSKVSGNVQIYGRTSSDPAVFARWLARWRQYFGVRTTIAVAGWASSDALSTPAGFSRYLAGLPAAPGIIVWDAAGGAPAYITESLAGYRPGGSRAAEAGQIALAIAAQPLAMVLAAVAVTVALLAGRR